MATVTGYDLQLHLKNKISFMRKINFTLVFTLLVSFKGS